MEIKEIVLKMLDDSQGSSDAEKDATFQLARSAASNLPAQAFAQAKAEHSLKLPTNEVGAEDIKKIGEALKLAFVLVFQDGFLRGLQLGKMSGERAENEKLTIPEYYKALRAFPDLEKAIAEVVRKKLEEIEPHLQEAISLPSYVGLDQRNLLLDTLAVRECSKLLDFAMVAGKACLEKCERET